MVVDEKSNFAGELILSTYTNGKDEESVQAITDEHWVDGIKGKAFLLNGLGENINFDVTPLKNLSSLTFSTWLRWEGNASGSSDPSAGFWWQRLFTIAGPEGWLTAMPWNYNDDPRTDGKIIDGLFAHGGMYEAKYAPPRREVDVYKPVKKNFESTGVALHDWSHIAVSMDGTNIKLYYNGELMAQKACSAKPSDFGMDFGRIGYSILGLGNGFEHTLNGAVDETCFYNKALSDAEIKAVYNKDAPKAGTTTTAKAGTTTGAKTETTTRGDATPTHGGDNSLTSGDTSSAGEEPTTTEEAASDSTEASGSMTTDTTAPANSANKPGEDKKSSPLVPILIVAVVIVVLGGGGAGFYLYRRKKAGDGPEDGPSDQPPSEA